MTVLFPPFAPRWWYVGATYAGHSDWAVDWNRRTQSGGWLEDRGDPVLACADGTVAQVRKPEGLVMIDHGDTRTEYRHMTDILVRVGHKVSRGDRIGSIGDVGNSTAPHLHLRQWKRTNPPDKLWVPTKLVLMGVPVRTSVLSDKKPADWKPPAPVMVQGQPLPETPEETIERLRDRLDAQKAQTDLFKDERDDARRDLAIAVAKIKELEARPDCHDVQDEVVRLRSVVDKVKALVTL